MLSQSHRLQIRKGPIAAPRRNCFNLLCFRFSKLSYKIETACWKDMSSGDTYSDISSGNHQLISENNAVWFHFYFQIGKDKNLVPQRLGFSVMPQISKSDKYGVYALKTEAFSANILVYIYIHFFSPSLLVKKYLKKFTEERNVT